MRVALNQGNQARSYWPVHRGSKFIPRPSARCQKNFRLDIFFEPRDIKLLCTRVTRRKRGWRKGFQPSCLRHAHLPPLLLCSCSQAKDTTGVHHPPRLKDILEWASQPPTRRLQMSSKRWILGVITCEMISACRLSWHSDFCHVSAWVLSWEHASRRAKAPTIVREVLRINSTLRACFPCVPCHFHRHSFGQT